MSGISTLSDPRIADQQVDALHEGIDFSPSPVARAQPDRTPRWHARWSEEGKPLRGREHLIVILSALTPDGDFGGATVATSHRWAQAKRIGDRWLVEVHDGHEGWPHVVVPLEGNEGIFAALSTAAGALWSHQDVAGVIWSWLNGSLPEGFMLVEAAGN